MNYNPLLVPPKSGNHDRPSAAQQFRQSLEPRVRTILSRMEPGEHLSIQGLIRSLAPTTREQEAAMYKSLSYMARHELADCVRRGPVKRVQTPLGGWVSKKTWIWAAYGTPHAETEKCPHCGGVL